MRFSQQDNGRRVRLRNGESFDIALDENPSTGFRWSALTATGCKLIQDQFTAPGLEPGRAGQRVLSWELMQIDLAELHLVLRREWEDAEKAIAEFRLLIEVIA